MKVLVIGDSCVDEFIYCDIERICPEAPVPVLKPIRSQQNPGMASNVVTNLEALGVKVDLVTNISKIKKTRYVDTRSGQMAMRVDENDQCTRYKGVYEIAGVYDNFSSDFGIMLYDDFPNFGGIKTIGGGVPGNSLGMLIWKARGVGKNEFVIVQDSITGGVQAGAFTSRYVPNYITENFEEITKKYGSNQTG